MIMMFGKKAPEEQDLPIEIPVIITHKNGQPAVELRRLTTDTELLKLIIRMAWHEQPIILLPRFNDKMRSLNSLVEKGVLYRGDDGQFYFNI